MPGKAVRVLLGLALVPSGLLAGAMSGLLFVRLFLPRREMGWDGIADALGGAMVGGLLGLVAAAILIAVLSPRGQAVALGAMATLAIGIAAWVAATRPRTEPSTAPAVEPSYRPTLRVVARVARSRELLVATPLDERPWPFTEIEVFSAVPEVVRIGWGPGFERTVTEPSTDELDRLVAAVRAAAAEAGELCRTSDPEDPVLAFSWSLDGEQGNQSLDAGCLAERPPFLRLGELLAETAEP